MSTILTWKPGRARENRARFWDSIARNSAQLVAIYDFLIARDNDATYAERLAARRMECIESGRKALLRAALIRRGLE